MSGGSRPAPGPTAGKDALVWYLASTGAWMGAMALQVYLVQWLLVFHLQADALVVGISRALIEVPPVAVLLLGGVLADRVEGRRLLVALAMAACLPPLALVALHGSLPQAAIPYWAVVIFGASMAMLQSAGDPGRAAAVNRVTRLDVQRTVTLATIATTAVSMAAVWAGGRIETLGLAAVLLGQAALLALSGVASARLPPLPPLHAGGQQLAAGVAAFWRTALVRNMIGINFVSALFNAGAYIVVIPLVVREVYQGDGAFLAALFVAFTAGNAAGNVGLLLAMPLRRPGRLFLLMQLTRMAILLGLWFEPAAWLLFALIAGWGVNMGVTTTLSRTTVQELAPAAHRAKILAVLLASFVVASPLSALLLGFVAQTGGASAGLLPGVVVSLAIFVGGLLGRDIWAYRPALAGPPRAE